MTLLGYSAWSLFFDKTNSTLRVNNAFKTEKSGSWDFSTGLSDEGSEIFTENIEKLNVTNISGDVEITPSAGGSTELTWKKKGPNQDQLDNLQVLYQVSGRTLTVKIEYKNKTNARASADFFLKIPESVEKLEIHNVSGNVRIKDIHESLEQEIKTVSGDISTTNGDVLDITSTSGNITAFAAKSMELRNTSGDIRFTFEGEDFKAVTVSGNIRGTFDTDSSFDKAEFKTVSGDVSVDAPDDLSSRISMKTTSGDMKCDFSLDKSSMSRNSLSGQIGSGSAEMEFKTVSGNIRLD